MVKKVIVFTLFVSLFFNVSMDRTQAAFNCLTLTVSSSVADKDYCKNELAQIEAELQNLLNQQAEQQKQTGTLRGDVNYLTSQINALKAKVRSRALVIAQLKVSIKEKVSRIDSLSSKISRQHQSIAQLIRDTNNFDNENFVHLILSDNTISSFYSDLESYASIKQAVKVSVDELRGIKTETETEKRDLEKKQNAETDAKVELESAQKKVAKSEAEKKRLLAISKNKEAAYQKLADEKKAVADRIRAALFPLRDSQAIPFGLALDYAREAEKKTGVRPAFVLAVLQQESSLGANVGSCVITNLTTGETKSVNSGKLFAKGIHPTRDLPALQGVVRGLGMNPLTTKVSCPLSVGYGGAMGPAQFIPSTWNLIKKELASALNKSTPNPWDPRDAIMASSIFLKNIGGAKQTFTAERNAACRYYSGRGCSDPKVKNLFYGNAVMKKAKAIQSDIDLL